MCYTGLDHDNAWINTAVLEHFILKRYEIYIKKIEQVFFKRLGGRGWIKIIWK